MIFSLFSPATWAIFGNHMAELAISLITPKTNAVFLICPFEFLDMFLFEDIKTLTF